MAFLEFSSGEEPRLCDWSGCDARDCAPQHRLRIRARVLSVGNLRANDDTRRRLEHLGDVLDEADESGRHRREATTSGGTAGGVAVGELEVAGEAEALDDPELPKHRRLLRDQVGIQRMSEPVGGLRDARWTG